MVQGRRKKHLGQHFIKNPVTAEKIVSSLEPGSTAVEIGPGEGILTSFLIEQFDQVILIEKDTDLLPDLESRFSDSVTIRNCDVLDCLEAILTPLESVSVASNLPYNISSPVTLKLCSMYMKIDEMVLMYQKEVADRILKEMSPLYAAANTFFDIKEIMKLKPGSFSPPPKVDSSVLLFKRKKAPFLEFSPDYLTFLRKLFQNKRKTLHNNMKHYLEKNTLEKISEKLCLPDKIRVEELSLDTIIKLYKEIH